MESVDKFKNGLLTAIEYDQEKCLWMCKCDCGSIVYRTWHQFKSAKSCGCLKRKNVTGKRFYDLTALKPTENRYRNHDVMWLCKCELCGSEKEYPLSYLTGGNVKNCGCQNQKMSKEHTQKNSKHCKEFYKYGTNVAKLEITKAKSNSKLGFRGVKLHRGKYESRITFAGKTYYLGSFSTPEEAHNAYLEKREELKQQLKEL